MRAALDARPGALAAGLRQLLAGARARGQVEVPALARSESGGASAVARPAWGGTADSGETAVPGAGSAAPPVPAPCGAAEGVASTVHTTPTASLRTVSMPLPVVATAAGAEAEAKAFGVGVTLPDGEPATLTSGAAAGSSSRYWIVAWPPGARGSGPGQDGILALVGDSARGGLCPACPRRVIHHVSQILPHHDTVQCQLRAVVSCSDGFRARPWNTSVRRHVHPECTRSNSVLTPPPPRTSTTRTANWSSPAGVHPGLHELLPLLVSEGRHGCAGH